MSLEDALNQVKASRKARRLRSLWPAIERKLADGVTHAEILGLLNANGFELTERTYKSYVYRFRRQRRGGGKMLLLNRAIEHDSLQSVDPGQEAICLTNSTGQTPKRPEAFDLDARGLPPELLK